MLMGHRFFPVVWFCLFLYFFLHVSGLIASLYFYLRVNRISLLAPYELWLSLWLYLSQALRLYFYHSVLFLFIRTATKPLFFFFFWEVLRPQHFYNIFTTNHRWSVVIGSNLNLTLRLLFTPTITTNNNLPLRICCKNVVDISFFFFLINLCS